MAKVKQATVQVPTTVDGNEATREVTVSQELYDTQMALKPEQRHPAWRNIKKNSTKSDTK